MAHVLICTFGLLEHNERLMPWRTVIEVARGLRDRGHDVDIMSLVKSHEVKKGRKNANVITIVQPQSRIFAGSLVHGLSRRRYDTVFVPVSISRNRSIKNLIANIEGPRVAYLPGSVFELRQIIRVLGKLPSKALAPYLFQALFPKFLFQRSLINLRCNTLITNSEYSHQLLNSMRRIQKISIMPGRDDAPKKMLVEEEQGGVKSGISPFFLFMGPPLAIRGIRVLLEAYMRIADEKDMPELLCLFRSDKHLQLEKIRRQYESEYRHAKIKFVWDSVSAEVLNEYIVQSVAVVMPFLIVPSEIPLAIYEAAGCGKFVITTGPSGTGDFVGQFGSTVNPGDVEHLSQALLSRSRSITNSYNELAFNAFKTLPTWDEVACQWNAVVENAHGYSLAK